MAPGVAPISYAPQSLAQRRAIREAEARVLKAAEEKMEADALAGAQANWRVDVAEREAKLEAQEAARVKAAQQQKEAAEQAAREVTAAAKRQEEEQAAAVAAQEAAAAKAASSNGSSNGASNGASSAAVSPQRAEAQQWIAEYKKRSGK